MAISSGTPEQTTVDSLRRVLEEHKADGLNQPDRLAGVLGDHFQRVEANLLIAAMKAGIPQQILSARPDTPSEVLLGTLQNRMIREHGFSIMSAQWSVQSWFRALRGGQSQGANPVFIPSVDGNTTPPALPKRSKINPRLLAGIGVAAAIAVGLVVIFWNPKPAVANYEFERLSFFGVDKPEPSPWELQDYYSWCDFVSNECATTLAFETKAPYIEARLGVSFPSKADASVPVHCLAVNGESQVSSDVTGKLPDQQYPILSRTAWMIPFKAPDGGWKAGTYGVQCTTDKGSVKATFKVE